MNKKGLGLLWIVLIAIGVIGGLLVVANWGTIQEAIGQGGQEAGISVTFYDEDGNPINSRPLSTVTAPGYLPVPGVSYISLTTTVLNTGDLPLSCEIISATPTTFDSALVKSAKVVPATGVKKASWTSNAFDITQFEASPTPDTFTVTVRCSYNVGTEVVYISPDQSYSIDLTIEPDGTGSYTVEIESPGGLGSEYCGNGVCESSIGETETTCPADCAVISDVNFRASDLSYVSGSAIAYSATCGTTLTQYGHTANTGLLSGTCSANMPTETWCGTTPVELQGIPGDFIVGGATATLWQPTESGTLCVCDDDGSTYKVVKYSTGDSDASKASSSAQSFDSSKEVLC